MKQMQCNECDEKDRTARIVKRMDTIEKEIIVPEKVLNQHKHTAAHKHTRQTEDFFALFLFLLEIKPRSTHPHANLII